MSKFVWIKPTLRLRPASRFDRDEPCYYFEIHGLLGHDNSVLDLMNCLFIIYPDNNVVRNVLAASSMGVSLASHLGQIFESLELTYINVPGQIEDYKLSYGNLRIYRSGIRSISITAGTGPKFVLTFPSIVLSQLWNMLMNVQDKEKTNSFMTADGNIHSLAISEGMVTDKVFAIDSNQAKEYIFKTDGAITVQEAAERIANGEKLKIRPVVVFGNGRWEHLK